MQIRILSKSEKLDSKEDIVIMIFRNSVNVIHTFAALRTFAGRYINDADLL